MIRYLILIVATIFLISGCTATPTPKFQFPADTRIGVVNQLEGYAYANIAAVVFKTEPLKYIGSGKPMNMESPIGDFDLSGDLKHLSQSEMNKLEPIIKKYADQAIVNALDDANLIIN